MRKLYERLSSLTPLLQGKQINYLPMMVGALKEQGVEEETVKDLVESFIQTMPVGDLGEKLYPKSSFDSYYIHKTNYYLGQLKQRSFDQIFQDLIKQPGDLGKTFEFAGIVRLHYALKSENELSLAEALALFDLSMEKVSIDVKEKVSYEDIKDDVCKTYKDHPSRQHMIALMSLFALEDLSTYMDDKEKIFTRFYHLVKNNQDTPQEVLTYEDLKRKNIKDLDRPLYMVAYDLIKC